MAARSASVTSSSRYTDSPAALLHSLARRSRLAVTTRKPSEHEQGHGDRQRREHRRTPPAPQAGGSLFERVLQRAHAQATSTIRPCSSVTARRPDPPDELTIVRRDDDGRAASVDLAEEIHDFERQIGIEVSGGLVGQDDVRVVDERPGNRDALLFAARQLVGQRVHPVLETDPLQHLEGLALLDLPAARRARA